MQIVRPAPWNWAEVSQTGVVPDGLSLITDSRPLHIVKRKVLKEDVNGNPSVMRLTGIFQRADEKNANGRIYPYDTLKSAVKNLQEAVGDRRVMGEFDHPPDAKIHLDRVSHLLTRIWMEGKVVYGEMEVINDDRCPCGSMLACLIERNVQVGISSRGVGDMEVTHLAEGEEAYEVQPGFNFVTFDAVAEPSVEGTQLMVMESRQREKQQQIAEQMQHQRVGAERNLLVEVHNLFGGRKLDL